MLADLPAIRALMERGLAVNEGYEAGAMHEDLRTACLAALELKREDAAAYARKFSWRAATEQFLANLHPRSRPLAALA